MSDRKRYSSYGGERESICEDVAKCVEGSGFGGSREGKEGDLPDIFV